MRSPCMVEYLFMIYLRNLMHAHVHEIRSSMTEVMFQLQSLARVRSRSQQHDLLYVNAQGVYRVLYARPCSYLVTSPVDRSAYKSI